MKPISEKEHKELKKLHIASLKFYCSECKAEKVIIYDSVDYRKNYFGGIYTLIPCPDCNTVYDYVT